MRLDQLLVAKKKFTSRSKAQAAIKEGHVFLPDGKVLKKPALDLSESTNLIVRDQDPYVSRGAYKLLKAIDLFEINYQNQVVLDIGASTGGFTQVALNHGAKKVFALDVGSNQLDPVIAQDSRVVVIENYNFRYAKPEDFPVEKFDLIQCDVSFISLNYIIKPAAQLLKPDGQAVFLIKPQFEAGREFVSKHGVVKNQKVVLAVLKRILTTLFDSQLRVNGLTFSPIKGQQGNIEFLVLAGQTGQFENHYSEADLKQLIQRAVKELN
ncbi:TlyA family RNA methyltransferase [Xylocopilactobacillus apicola]|uniref:TlyA family rRNA (Cytidine-2'-O)-methyltransferase n=1 Tax=Xylocopilactobacillus apicola TaxID=2932184 RepID=A0AAU9D306_9LACO|nr:TlyA family RNA methyltransferase [Xylocopilactobacillus apicola]BDR58149.1 TlyA family rRNA (cytidine-2'-O)-methyltransferase [Xylocopilactobacillus apicola]